MSETHVMRLITSLAALELPKVARIGAKNCQPVAKGRADDLRRGLKGFFLKKKYKIEYQQTTLSTKILYISNHINL